MAEWRVIFTDNTVEIIKAEIVKTLSWGLAFGHMEGKEFVHEEILGAQMFKRVTRVTSPVRQETPLSNGSVEWFSNDSTPLVEWFGND